MSNTTSPTINPLIRVEGVTRTYHVDRREVPALRGVDLTVTQGELVSLRGRSGSGKTTMLNCIGGLDRPTSGLVRVFGQDLTKLNDKELTHYHRVQVGFIFQSFGLTSTYSAFENVELLLRIAGSGLKQRRERAAHCLEL